MARQVQPGKNTEVVVDAEAEGAGGEEGAQEAANVWAEAVGGMGSVAR
jgi:hypothetical protein